jgi:hypothetical protein
MPQYDDRIHHAHVVTSDSSTGKITVNIPGKFGNSETVDVSFIGREKHDANSKWLVPAAGDSIIVCQEDEDCTNGVFWLNTTVPPDPPYTFVDGGPYLQFTKTRMGGSITLDGDWYSYDTDASKYNLYHTGHSNTTTGGLTIRSTGLSERGMFLYPAYVSGGTEWSAIFRDNANANILMNGTLRPYSVIPYVGSTYNLGSASIQWSQIYLVNNPIVSSDQNYKTDIVDSNLGLDFVNALRPVSFKLTHTDGREGVRTHYGLIAQEVESVLGDDASDTAIWTKETIEASPEVPADEYLPGQPAVEEHGKQGLRYDELISPMIKAIQELTTRLTALESA